MAFWRSDVDDDAYYDQPDDDYVVASSPRAKVNEQQQQEEEEIGDDPWTTALHDTCLSLNSLYATPQQVMQKSVVENESFERPKQSEVMLWSNTDKVSTLVECYKRKQKEIDAKEQASSSWWISRVASRVYNTVAVVSKVNDDDYIDLDWNQAGEDHSVSAAPCEVPWKEPVLHLDLAVQCCQGIVSKAKESVAIFEAEKNQERHAVILYREGTADNCFMGWIRKLQKQKSSSEQDEEDDEKYSTVISPEHLLLSKLPDDQMQVLLDVLLELNYARLVDDDMIVVGGDAEQQSEDSVAVSLFRLDSAMKKIDTRIQHWTEQRDSSLTQALKYNKKSKTNATAKNLVMTHLRRKQLYDRNLAQAHATLLNLQQTRGAVETAQSQVHITKVLSETAMALHDLNANGVTVDQVEDLKDDLQEEYEHLDMIHGSLTAQDGQTEGDDKLLLQELEALMITDDNTNTNLPPSSHDSPEGGGSQLEEPNEPKKQTPSFNPAEETQVEESDSKASASNDELVMPEVGIDNMVPLTVSGVEDGESSQIDTSADQEKLPAMAS